MPTKKELLKEANLYAEVTIYMNKSLARGEPFNEVWETYMRGMSSLEEMKKDHRPTDDGYAGTRKPLSVTVQKK